MTFTPPHKHERHEKLATLWASGARVEAIAGELGYESALVTRIIACRLRKITGDPRLAKRQTGRPRGSREAPIRHAVAAQGREGKKIWEIAQDLKLSKDCVRSHLSYARRLGELA